MRQILKLIFALLTIFLIVATVTVVALPVSVSPAPKIRAVFRPVEAAFGAKKSLNILLLGLDYNYDENAQRHTKGSRSDTIIVVRVDPLGSHLSMMSLPRDLYVALGKNANYGYDRINAAHSFGGVALTRETVEQLTGLEIDHYVVVKPDVVADLVDLIGGVPIEVEKQMDWDDHWAGLHIHLKPGHQVLSGEDAVGYCRFRQDEEGDFGRIERQQKFLGALLKELKRPKHWETYPKLARALKDNVTTDLKDEQLLGLARIYRGFLVENLTKGRPEVEDYLHNGAAYLILAPGEPKNTVDELFFPLPDQALTGIKMVVQVKDQECLEEGRRVAQLMRRLGAPHVRLKHNPDGLPGSDESLLCIEGGSSDEVAKLREMFPRLKVERIKTEGRLVATLHVRSSSVLVVLPSQPG